VSYALVKVVHLLALVVWIGPPLGAYFLLAMAWREGDDERITWTERLTERVLRVEHGALVVWLGSGVALLWLSDWAWLSAPWMHAKLALVGVVLAFEVFDIWHAHVLSRRVFEADDPRAHPHHARMVRSRLWLIRLALVLGLVIPLVFWLAVYKAI
jgi:uncharacterized membrane protein